MSVYSDLLLQKQIGNNPIYMHTEDQCFWKTTFRHKVIRGKIEQVVFSGTELPVHLTWSLPHILHLRRNTIDILKYKLDI